MSVDSGVRERSVGSVFCAMIASPAPLSSPSNLNRSADSNKSRSWEFPRSYSQSRCAGFFCPAASSFQETKTMLFPSGFQTGQQYFSFLSLLCVRAMFREPSKAASHILKMPSVRAEYAIVLLSGDHEIWFVPILRYGVGV